MAIMSSISILRYRMPAVFSLQALYSRHVSSVFGLTSAKQNPSSSRKPPPAHKILIRPKTLSTRPSPSLSPNQTPSLSPSQAIGMVAASQANFMRVIVQSLPEPLRKEGRREDDEKFIGVELLCVVRAVLKKIKRRVLVGDRVVISSIDWVDRRGLIEDVYQRESENLDPPVANVDHLLVLFSTEQPKLEPYTLTRFLIEAESTGIPFTLALNKSELVDEETLIMLKSKLRSWGYKPIFCSVGSKLGIDHLKFILTEQTTVIAGPSGVGKSSLINALRSTNGVLHPVEEDNWLDQMVKDSKWFEDQRVGEVSTRNGRGKHTTRHVSLLPLSEGGYLADTPGFNQPSLIRVTKHSLAQTFPEIRKKLSESQTKCAFSDCLHIGEPGCIIGSDWERYSYYLQLLDEIRIREEFQLRTFGTKRESDVRYKVGELGVKQAEPRLEPKKHRRQSRKRINQSIQDELDDPDDDDDVSDNPVIRAAGNENQQ